MKNKTHQNLLLILSLGGLLFSGYLSAIKLFSDTCAFNEPCPYFLGYPACWYGFVLFFILFISSLLCFWRKMDLKKTSKINSLISFLGILFAGYFTLPELKSLLTGTGGLYSLGLPTCAYGLIFYMIIFILSIKSYSNTRHEKK